jgi:alanyl-tRNA synthetase
LHEALRQVLGTHVAQKGSLVAPERLRFDFSHPKPMSAEEVAAVEDMANAIILQNAPVETRLMAIEDAMETGAMALFGEKYGDEVRVVSMGVGEAGAGSAGGGQGKKANKAWSVELCGGTHVKRTGDIGLVRVVAEAASAAGVRRIEALTGQGARAYLAEQDARVREVAGALRARPEEVVDRVKELLEGRKQLERDLANAKRQLALSGGGAAGNGAAAAAEQAVRTVGKVKFMARAVKGLEPRDLRGLVDDGKAQIGSGVVAIVGVTEEGKANLTVGVTDDLSGRISALELIKAGAEALGAKGAGGKATFAQTGAPDGSKAEAALKAIEAKLGSLAS